jgi:tRNA(Ile)-lysidine synthase
VVYIPGLGVAKISVFPRDKHKIVPRETYTKWFDYDRIQEVSFRQRKKGDFILFDTKDGLRQKSISKFMTDSKIPKSQRDSMYLLADRDHIIWVPGYRMSAAYKVTETTKNILSIKITAGGISNG